MLILVRIYFSATLLIKFGSLPRQEIAPVLPAAMFALLLFFDLLNGLLGGYLCSKLAGRGDSRAPLYLAILIFVIYLSLVLAAPGKEPGWYMASRQIGMFAAILFGGRARRKN